MPLMPAENRSHDNPSDIEQDELGQLFTFFPDLQEEKSHDLVEIIEDAIDHEFDQNQRILYTQGDPITRLFLVVKGNVEEMEVAPFTPGQTMKRVVGPGTL